MRPDMAQVIIERPRHGSRSRTKGKGYGRRTAKLAWEDAVKTERMKDRGGRTKHLNENLAPLRRFLAGKVGQPWSKVHSEVCENLSRDSGVQDHVRDHLEDYVTMNVIVVDGELCRGDGYGVGRPLSSLFYVCPQTGVLKRNRRDWRKEREVRKLVRFPLADGSSLVRYRGAWHVAILWRMPPLDPHRLKHEWDALLKEHVGHRKAERVYGEAIHAVHSRLANKQEIRSAINGYPRPNRAH